MTTLRSVVRRLLVGVLWVGVAVCIGAVLVGAGWLLSRLLLWLGVG